VTASAGRSGNAGLGPFLLIWAGQSVSVVGTSMTNFALVIWIWSRTGQAMPIALMELCSYGAVVALGPIAGVVCDRWGRGRTLIASNAGAAVVIAALWLLLGSGNLTEQAVYVSMVALGSCLAFQYPALMASVTSLVAQRHYMRASGMLSLTISVAGIVGPAAAAVLLGTADLPAVFAADLVSYGICVLTVALVRMPAAPTEPASGKSGVRQDLGYGFRYVAARPGLLALQAAFFLSYFAGMFGVLLAPMVLARAHDGTATLAAVLGAAGLGGIAGGVVTTVWGGRRSHLPVILLGFVATGLLGQLPLGLSASPIVWIAASFSSAFLFPLIQGANQAIWQTSVPVAVQGRVFAARRVMTESAGPIVLLVAGPLADRVFEPGMGEPGWLRSGFGWLVGTEPGAGMGVIFVLTGLLSVLVGVLGFTVPWLRRLDADISTYSEVRQR
jgi:MFS family permease